MKNIWRTVDVIVTPNPVSPERYQVEFRPRNRKREAKADVWEIETNMVLFVEYRGHLQVNSFTKATTPIPGFDLADYELKAILAVSEYRLHNP
jgi:hypothetical protein